MGELSQALQCSLRRRKPAQCVFSCLSFHPASVFYVCICHLLCFSNCRTIQCLSLCLLFSCLYLCLVFVFVVLVVMLLFVIVVLLFFVVVVVVVVVDVLKLIHLVYFLLVGTNL